MPNTNIQLSAIDDNGYAVDWWFIYKIAGKSQVSDGSHATGTEYIYFDANNIAGKKLVLSPHKINDPNAGAVSNTLNQLYNNPKSDQLGWVFYNDENPLDGTVNGSRGHTKGVLAFDDVTDSGFWLIDSAPKFPGKGKYSYPETAMSNAQTFLCITLENADTAKQIAAQMYVAQQPNVYLSSKEPADLNHQTDASDRRIALIHDKITSDNKAYADFIPFKSKGKQQFRCYAKNKHWDEANNDDFYNDLVGPSLAENLDVLTWEHGAEPDPLDNDKVHTVVAMKAVDLSVLGIHPSYSWSEENDHAKLAITARSEAGQKYICVGDINFTKTMEKRSGGTVAFICNDLWSSISSIFKDVNVRTSSKVKDAKNVQSNS